MKPTLSLLIAALISLSISKNAAAQKDTSTVAIFKTWDDFLARIKKEKKPDATTTASIESDPGIKAIRHQLLAEINQYLSGKDKAEPWKEWTSSRQPKTGDMNLLPLLEGAPAPVYILPQAGQTDVEAKFDPCELNEFIGGYKWGSHSSENIFTPEADQEVASGIGAAYALMNQIAKEAKGFTSIAKGYQKQFETISTGK